MYSLQTRNTSGSNKNTKSMICKIHGDVGEPLSNGECIQCEREKIGPDGIEMLAVLFDLTEGKQSADIAKVASEFIKRENNRKSGMDK